MYRLESRGGKIHIRFFLTHIMPFYIDSSVFPNVGEQQMKYYLYLFYVLYTPTHNRELNEIK